MMSIFQTITDDVIQLACTIQQIPAPTDHESLRAEFMLAQYNRLGLSRIHKDGTGNALACLPGGNAAPLVICAHMDTVFPQDHSLTLQREGDTLYGPSIGDNSLGLAGMIGLVEMIHQEKINLPGDLWLAASVGEEGLGNLKGMRALVEYFQNRPLAYIIVEGMGLGNVFHRGLGVERYEIGIQTPGGHSWAKYGQPSAIHELAGIIVKLVKIPLPLQPRTTLNVGIVKGGTSVNTIAAHASMEIDLRSEEQDQLLDLVGKVRKTVEAAERPGVHHYLRPIGSRPAGSIPKDHALVRLAQECLQKLGLTALPGIASTDANIPLAHGYPAICIGLTEGDGAHSDAESILTPPLALGLAQLLAITQRAWEI